MQSKDYCNRHCRECGALIVIHKVNDIGKEKKCPACKTLNKVLYGCRLITWHNPNKKPEGQDTGLGALM